MIVPNHTLTPARRNQPNPGLSPVQHFYDLAIGHQLFDLRPVGLHFTDSHCLHWVKFAYVLQNEKQ
jgi:hypothetical protein